MKARALLIIVGSILIGIIVGFLISAQLRHKRMKPIRVMSSERHFRAVLYKVIEPSDELKKELEPIIESYGKEGRELQREFRKSFETHNENYWNEIKELLSQEQLKKLEDYNKNREEEMRSSRPDTSRGRRGDWNERRGPPQRGRHDSQRRDSSTLIPDTIEVIN